MRNTSIVLLSTLLCGTVLAAQDWNQWRGPARSGITNAFKAPPAWPERPKQVWKTAVGLGHSSPVVSGDRVFVHTRTSDRDQEAVTAYELSSGRQIWRQVYDAPYAVNPAARSHGKGPKSTPLLAGGRLFTFGISGILSAWDSKTGRLIWRKDFKKDFAATSPDYGTGMSPVLAGAHLIVHAGGPGNGAMLGIDPATGAVKWSWKADGPAYSSPVLAEIGGVRQVITQSQRHVVGLAAATGQPLWQIPFTTEYDQNIVTPVVSNDLVVYSGMSTPLVAVRVTRNADGRWSTAKVWENPDLPMYMSSPVLHRGHVFGLSHRNRGQFFCVDLATGKTVWTTRGREGENAALILAGDLLMATTTEGELVVARADPKGFTPLRRYTIAESPVWAHPVPAGAGVLIKDAETLAYWTF
jgi:outer membrane protein assembly factor BamB